MTFHMHSEMSKIIFALEARVALEKSGIEELEREIQARNDQQDAAHARLTKSEALLAEWESIFKANGGEK